MTAPINPATAVGTVALSVGDLRRSIGFYTQSIGLTLLNQADGCATLGAGATPLLKLVELRGARIVRRATGLYHFALRLPSRRDLALQLRHFADSGIRLDGASDHRFSEALYLHDPDGHGIEIYRDRTRDTWYDAAGNLRGASDPLDLAGIMAELDAAAPAWQGLSAAADMGHIHLQVADIAAAERFYVDGLGFERMIRMPTASFIGAGGYHHHIGMNTWAGVGVPAPPACAARLLDYEVWLPTPAALDATVQRIRDAALPLTELPDAWSVRDPSAIDVYLRVKPA